MPRLSKRSPLSQRTPRVPQWSLSSHLSPRLLLISSSLSGLVFSEYFIQMRSFIYGLFMHTFFISFDRQSPQLRGNHYTKHLPHEWSNFCLLYKPVIRLLWNSEVWICFVVSSTTTLKQIHFITPCGETIFSVSAFIDSKGWVTVEAFHPLTHSPVPVTAGAVRSQSPITWAAGTRASPMSRAPTLRCVPAESRSRTRRGCRRARCLPQGVPHAWFV